MDARRAEIRAGIAARKRAARAKHVAPKHVVTKRVAK
jgi:hypothetical protein